MGIRKKAPFSQEKNTMDRIASNVLGKTKNILKWKKGHLVLAILQFTVIIVNYNTLIRKTLGYKLAR